MINTIDELKHKLNAFKHLQENWDGHNGVLINPKSIENAQKFIEKLPKDIKKLPDVSPITNGSVSVSWEVNDLYIDIEFHSDNTYSFYADHPDLNEIEVENQKEEAFKNKILKNYIQYIL